MLDEHNVRKIYVTEYGPSTITYESPQQISHFMKDFFGQCDQDEVESEKEDFKGCLT